MGAETGNSVLVTQKCGVIKCDFEGAKKYLQSRLDEYKGVVFTEDTKNDAKKVVAELRKEKKAFGDRVKEVKAEYMKPFDNFYAQASELNDMYDEPINYINAQITEFERKRVEEKKLLIESLYDECIAEMSEQLPLAKIYNPKWENATCNPTAIRRDMMERKMETKTALETIVGMKSDVEELAINMYLESFDLSKSIGYITQHEQQKQEILAREQERIRREEEERIRREERARMEAEMRAEEERRIAVEEARQEMAQEVERAVEQAVEATKEEARQEAIDSLIPDFAGESSLYEYRMSLAADAKEKLEMYLDSVGIEWELM